MNFKTTILILTLVLTAGNNFSQLTSFKWSEGVKKGSDEFSKIISLEKSSVVVFKDNESSVRLDFFSKEGKQTSELVTFKGTYLDLFKVNNSIVVFSTTINNITQKDELLATIINNGNKKEILILEQNLIGSLHNQFKINVSPDFQKVFILTEKPHKKGKKESVIFTVLNQNLELERTESYLMSSILSQKRKINVPIINNNGDVYLLKRYREERAQSRYYVLGYPSSGRINFNEFKLNYKPIQDAQYMLNYEGDLIIGGTYSSPNRSRSEGTYIARYNPLGEKVYRKEYGFRPETMLVFTSERSLKKYGLGLDNFRTNKLIQQKESITLILEHRSSEANSKSGVNTDKQDGLIVSTYDINGNYIWDRSIVMHQNDDSERGYWSSFMSFNDTTTNKLTLIYNEVGYFDKKADNEFGEHVAVGARSIVIDNQGNYTREAVKNSFEGASVDLIFNSRFASQRGREMLMIAEPKDKSVYVLGVVD